MKETRVQRQKRVSREEKELSTLKEYVNPIVDVEASLHKYKHLFKAWEEYWAFVNDIKSLVLYAQDQSDSYRLFEEKRKAVIHDAIDKIKVECERLNLPKGQTVDRETKYKIARAVGMRPGNFNSFKSGQKVYHRITTNLAGLGYHRTPQEDPPS